MRNATVFLPLLVLAAQASAQTPRLEGTVRVTPSEGILSGAFCLSGLPARDSVHFILHRGLNIERVRSPDGVALRYAGHDELRPVGVAALYTVLDTLPVPQAFCVDYVGAFPVYRDTLNTFDYQEVIAFDGRAVRAAPSTRWYPTPYDPAMRRADEALAYRVRVECPGCAAVYLNGTAPCRGPGAELASERPWPLLLYAGDFPVTFAAGAWFLGDTLPPATARAFTDRVRQITEFYERFLSVPFTDTLVFLRTLQVRPSRAGNLWGFFVLPTMATNVDFARFVEAGAVSDLPPEVAERLRRALWGVLAHEFAHYYFGTLLRPSGPWEQFYGESFASYLALKALRRLQGESAYREALDAHLRNYLQGPPLTPLDRVGEADPVRGDRYRYHYGTLLLVALEMHAGGEREMGRILRRLLALPAGAPLDYAALREAALLSEVRPERWEEFERRCIREFSQERCLPPPVPAEAPASAPPPR